MQTDFGKEDQTPFEIHSRREIVGYLRSIKNSSELISMALQSKTEAMLTYILYIDDEADALVFDGATDQILNEKMASGGLVQFSVSLDHVKILFDSNMVKECTYAEKPAFLLPLPKTLVRFQRREHYRISTSIAHPVLCQIPIEKAGSKKIIALPLLDISVGGIALRDENRELESALGTVYENCRIEMSGSVILVNLKVCSSVDITNSASKNRRRLGCAFVNTSHSMLSSVQRYIMKLEREQKNRLSGL